MSKKVVRGFGKESCVSTGVRKLGNTDRHGMTLAVKEALNPNTTNNQSIKHYKFSDAKSRFQVHVHHYKLLKINLWSSLLTDVTK